MSHRGNHADGARRQGETFRRLFSGPMRVFSGERPQASARRRLVCTWSHFWENDEMICSRFERVRPGPGRVKFKTRSPPPTTYLNGDKGKGAFLSELCVFAHPSPLRFRLKIKRVLR